MIAAAPCAVEQAVVVCHHSQSLVGIVVITARFETNRSTISTPKLDLDDFVLGSICELFFCVSHRCAVEVVAKADSEHFQDCGSHVGVTVRNRRVDALRNIRPANEQRNVHIFFVRAAFTRKQTMITDMEACRAC